MYRIRQYLLELSKFHRNRIWVVQVLCLATLVFCVLNLELGIVFGMVTVLYTCVLQRWLVLIGAGISIAIHVIGVYLFGNAAIEYDIIAVYAIIIWFCVQTLDHLTQYEYVE